MKIEESKLINNVQLQRIPVITIFGPTASQKTLGAIRLHQGLLKNGIQSAIVNFDSLCFFHELTIGTAKPTPQEMLEAPHYLVGHKSIFDAYNAHDFTNDAFEIIKKIHQNNSIAILVGGSGFYLRALIKGMYSNSSSNPSSTVNWNSLYLSEGIEPIRNFLQLNDPDSLKLFHHNDHYRLTRAAQFFSDNHRTLSEEKKKLDIENPYDFSNSNLFQTLNFYFYPEKSTHLQQIEARTKKMLTSGLIEEIIQILKSMPSNFPTPILQNCLKIKPLNSIGYKEVIQWFIDHELDFEIDHWKNSHRDKLIENIVISTRQLSKSQKTFFNKIHPRIIIDPNHHESIELLTKASLQFINEAYDEK